MKYARKNTQNCKSQRQLLSWFLNYLELQITWRNNEEANGPRTAIKDQKRWFLLLSSKPGSCTKPETPIKASNKRNAFLTTYTKRLKMWFISKPNIVGRGSTQICVVIKRSHYPSISQLTQCGSEAHNNVSLWRRVRTAWWIEQSMTRRQQI